MNAVYIDINCDVGEGVGNESQLFPLISSCNIACGGHAGDKKSIREVAILAKEQDVKVGAHPSYPDRESFGRKVMDISDENLKNSVKEQMKFFLDILSQENIRMHHIKPHGALYNTIAVNRNLAVTFLEAIEDYRAESMLYVPPKSQIANEADRRGFRLKYEAFADRNYNDDLTLVSRDKADALITEPSDVFTHLESMVLKGFVRTINGSEVKLSGDTYCIHGDTANAFEILAYLSREFPKRGIFLMK